jgi:hypothetical protein
VPTSIIATTKSGTSQLHGTAFETNKNGPSALLATGPILSPPRPYNRNEYGISAGGPVYIPKLYNGKNRTFGSLVTGDAYAQRRRRLYGSNRCGEARDSAK